jgi:acetoin utilization deacetylase AcuC-like enzyme
MDDIVYFYPDGHEAHFQKGHPERPERVEVIRNSLKQIGWWDKYPKLDPLPIDQATLEEIHSADYINTLRSVCERGISLDMDTYTTPASWELANRAAGGGIAVARAVWQGKAQRGLALTRPPGHHATISQGMGFCLLNNIALAAQDLLKQNHPEITNAERIAIIDLDLHHGNGTQDIFYKRGDIFYVSIHQSPLYPGTGSLDDIGIDEGKGKNANFPVPPFTGDSGYQAIMDEVIIPLINKFSPEIILVSVGFDIHWMDPLGQLMVTAQGYRHLIKRLTEWADENCSGKIVLFLEGGYDLNAGASCAQAFVSALLNIPWKDSLGASSKSESDQWMPILKRALEIWA